MSLLDVLSAAFALVGLVYLVDLGTAVARGSIGTVSRAVLSTVSSVSDRERRATVEDAVESFVDGDLDAETLRAKVDAELTADEREVRERVEEVDALGPETAAHVALEVETLDDLRGATVDDLRGVDHLSPTLAERLVDDVEPFETLGSGDDRERLRRQLDGAPVESLLDDVSPDNVLVLDGEGIDADAGDRTTLDALLDDDEPDDVDDGDERVRDAVRALENRGVDVHPDLRGHVEAILDATDGERLDLEEPATSEDPDDADDSSTSTSTSSSNGLSALADGGGSK